MKTFFLSFILFALHLNAQDSSAPSSNFSGTVSITNTSRSSRQSGNITYSATYKNGSLTQFIQKFPNSSMTFSLTNGNWTWRSNTGGFGPVTNIGDYASLQYTSNPFSYITPKKNGWGNLNTVKDSDTKNILAPLSRPENAPLQVSPRPGPGLFKSAS